MKFRRDNWALVVLALGLISLPVRAQPKPQQNQTQAVAFKAKAVQVCTEGMSNQAANKIIQPGAFIKDCVDQVVVSGKLDLAEEHKNRYKSAVEKLKKPQPPGFKAKAAEACTKAMTIPEANAILSPKEAIAECIEDTLLTGGFDFVEPAKNRYLSAVKRLIQSTKNEPAKK